MRNCLYKGGKTMKSTNIVRFLFSVLYRSLCVFLCVVISLTYTNIISMAHNYVNLDKLGSPKPEKSNAIVLPSKALTPIPLSGSDYSYYGAQTQIFVKTNGGYFVNKTTDILQNGYVGRAGENTIIRLQLSGYKYKENAFSYRVTQCGGVKWGSWYLYQDNTGSIGAAGSGVQLPFTDSLNSTFYSRCCVAAQFSFGFSISEIAKSIYQYTRSLNYYKSPQDNLLYNGYPVAGTESAGNISQFATLSRTSNATYNSLCELWGYAYGYWSRIANSYVSLADTSRNQVVKDKMSNDGDSTLISQTSQWNDADTTAYNYLAYTTTNTHKYVVYQEIDLSKITDASSAFGQYSISIDNGAVTSQSFPLSLYEVNDSLTMQQSQTSGAIATDSAAFKVYNASGQAINITTQAANATLGGSAITLVNNGFFTTNNVETFGSTTAMSKIEATLNNTNLNSTQSLPNVPAGNISTFPISLKNANSISQQLSGEITFLATIAYGSTSKSDTISIALNSVVPQITVSVPISIYLYISKDGSIHVPNDGYYLSNLSTFPLTSQISAILIENETTGLDEYSNPYFPTITELSSFKLWVNSTQNNIQFTSISADSPATDFKDFGTIFASGGRLDFNITTDGSLPMVSNPGVYHYKIYFKFSYSLNDL